MRRRQLFIAAMLALIGACGGGSDPGVGSGGTGTSNPGTQLGAVSGFGSVLIEGNRYDDTQSEVLIDIDPATPALGTRSALRLGMVAEARFDEAERATRVRVLPELIGAVESVAADRFVVAGQTVRVRGIEALEPVFEGFDDIDELSVGDRVIVHGLRDGTDALFATRIERADETSVGTRVTGTVALIAGDRTSLRVGALTVTLSASTRIAPAAAVLAVGQRVVVYASQAPVAGVLAARSVSVESFALAAGERVRTAGIVRAVDAGALTFSAGSTRVDASAAQFVNGSAGDITNGRLVRVQGTWNGTAIAATEVRFLRTTIDASTNVRGTIGDFVSASSFRIRFTRIDASAGNVEFRTGTAADLGADAEVRVDGVISGGVLRATRVEFITRPSGPGSSDARAETRGLAYAIDIGQRQLRVNGVTVRWSTDTRIDGDLATLRAGTPVRALGRFEGGVLQAERLEIRPLN